MLRPTVQLCSVQQNPAEPKSPRCALPLGHAGAHEALKPDGTRLKFDSTAVAKPRR